MKKFTTFLMFVRVGQTNVDQEVRQMREALDAQNAAEVTEINQCLEKVSRSSRGFDNIACVYRGAPKLSQLASGFPDPAAADSELQEMVRTRSHYSGVLIMSHQCPLLCTSL
jgi:hypothetical protein